MKARHALIALLTFGIGIASLAEAQRGKRGRMRRGAVNMTEEQKAEFQARRQQLVEEGQCGIGLQDRTPLFDQLELTEEQKAELLALRQSHREEMQARRETGERPTQEEIAAFRQAHQEALADILDEEQLAKLEELRAQRQEKMGEQGRKWLGKMRGGRRGGGRVGPFQALDLTDAQKEQIKTAMQQLREEIGPDVKAIREKVRSGELPREEARAAMQEIRSAHQGILADILTDTQKELLEELKAQRQARREAAGLDDGATPEAAAKAAVENQSWGSIKKNLAK
jgi:Spy/CpxP family protein refolding chaperone